MNSDNSDISDHDGNMNRRRWATRSASILMSIAVLSGIGYGGAGVLAMPARAAQIGEVAASAQSGQPASSGCIDTGEWRTPVIDGESSRASPALPQLRQRAHATLRDLIAQSLAHSQAIGAVRLLAEAAAIDVEEARAARYPRASLTAGLARAASTIDSREQYDGSIARGGLNITAPIYDGGRTTESIGWRQHLADAARLGQIDAQEQIALQTLSLALDLDRYDRRAQVAQQQAARMGCMVDSLERAVAADQGRRSELDQARKTLQEAQLTQSRSAASKRQVELRLRRFTGKPPPSLEGLDSVLDAAPLLEELVASSAQSSALRQLAAQANAADAQTRAIAASGKPRIDLALDGSRTAGAIENTTWQIGLNLVVPLYDAGLSRAADAAARRAEAARLQLADSTEARASRLADVHDQADALARDSVALDAILDNSARVREATLAQWQRLGRRSLFDVMSAERDHFSLRIAQVDAQHDRQQANALLWSLGVGVDAWLSSSPIPAAGKAP